MTDERPVWILPAETQVREFDARLLVACFGAERGARVIVGSRIEIHRRIASLPRGLYVSKDVFRASRKIFEILADLGHRIVALDEEGMLYDSPEDYRTLYLPQRVAADVLSRIELFLAWGPLHAAAMPEAPGFPGCPIVITGNPRIDWLRPELAAAQQDEVETLRRRHGEFVLVNTNFGRLNHVLAADRIEDDPEQPGSLRNVTQTRLPESFWRERLASYGAFRELLPRLARALAPVRIVVRPHPAERAESWRECALGLTNVEVVREGAIAPWLRAARVVIHNACTTGLEAHLAGTPVIAYSPVRAAQFDENLANLLSLRAETPDELLGAVKAALCGTHSFRPPARAHERLAAQIGALEGELSAERMGAALANQTTNDPRVWWSRAFRSRRGRRRAAHRAQRKEQRAGIAGHKNSADYGEQRFPGIELPAVEARIDALRRTLSRFDGVKARPLAPSVFLIESTGPR